MINSQPDYVKKNCRVFLRMDSQAQIPGTQDRIVSIDGVVQRSDKTGLTLEACFVPWLSISYVSILSASGSVGNS